MSRRKIGCDTAYTSIAKCENYGVFSRVYQDFDNLKKLVGTVIVLGGTAGYHMYIIYVKLLIHDLELTIWLSKGS